MIFYHGKIASTTTKRAKKMKMTVSEIIRDTRSGNSKGSHVQTGLKGFYGNGGKSVEYQTEAGEVVCIIGEKNVANARFGSGTAEVITFKLNGKRIAYKKLKDLIG